MSGMEVHGRDAAREAYRVSIAAREGRIAGLVPEALMDTPALGAPRHQHAYDWLARNRGRIEAALRARRDGRPVRAPFDRVTLAEET